MPDSYETKGTSGKFPIPPETGLPSDVPMVAILEALLFACEEPLRVADLAALLGQDRLPEIERVMHALCDDYESDLRGLRIQAIAGGYRLTTDPRIAPFVREMVRTQNRKRLSRAALETLAIVAYKQPITAPEIQEIRGVNSSSILGSLLDRRLVRLLGRKRVVGKPFLYGTSQDFLVRFGLNTVGDLPSMDEFDRLVKAEKPEPTVGSRADIEARPPTPSESMAAMVADQGAVLKEDGMNSPEKT